MGQKVSREDGAMARTEREIFAKNLRAVVEKSHLQYKDIAAELGVSRGTMSDYIHARNFPRPEKLAQLCNILGVSQYDLTTDFYSNEEEFVPNGELWHIAKEIHDNPDARAIYTDIKSLEEDEVRMVRTLIQKLKKKK